MNIKINNNIKPVYCWKKYKISFSENIINDLLKFSSAIGARITPRTIGAVGYLHNESK